MRHPDIMVVVPCYNEVSRLDVGQFKAAVADTPGLQFIFVDDGSTDATSELLCALNAAAPDVFHLLSLKLNMGKAEAVRQGLLVALEHRPEYAAFWDADLATPLQALPTFCTILQERPHVEMVFGSRVRMLGRQIDRRASRHLIARGFATVVSLMLRLPVYDTQCGAKMFRVSDHLRMLFDEQFVSRWLFDIEIIARLIRARRGTALPRVEDVIYELPLAKWHDVAGSKITYGDAVRAVLDLAAIYRRYLWGPA